MLEITTTLSRDCFHSTEISLFLQVGFNVYELDMNTTIMVNAGDVMGIFNDGVMLLRMTDNLNPGEPSDFYADIDSISVGDTTTLHVDLTDKMLMRGIAVEQINITIYSTLYIPGPHIVTVNVSNNDIHRSFQMDQTPVSSALSINATEISASLYAVTGETMIYKILPHTGMVISIRHQRLILMYISTQNSISAHH